MKFYLIFIVACLTNQLKADVFTVEVTDIIEGDITLATIKEDPNFIVTFPNEVWENDIKYSAIMYDSEGREIGDSYSESPCDMDTSTKEGTLAAILWGSLGIHSCPIDAGDYSVVSKFDQTGVIDGVFESVNDLVSIEFEFLDLRNNRYFELKTDVRLVEQDSPSQDDD